MIYKLELPPTPFPVYINILHRMDLFARNLSDRIFGKTTFYVLVCMCACALMSRD